METILLLILAVAPPAAFMVFIFWMDRHEPESLKTVLAAMGIGALSVIPALIIQIVTDPIYLFHIEGLAGSFYKSFLVVAPSEELSKFLFIYLFLKHKPFYDEVNDGIVYYGAGALGFALLENVFYVLDHGLATGILRAFTAIPIHTFCGVIIGYHAGLARFTNQPKPRKLIIRGLFLAYLTHATYNTFVLAESLLALLSIPLVIAVYVIGYKLLHRGRQISLAGGVINDREVPFTKLLTEPPVINYSQDEVTVDSKGRKYLTPKKETWKIIFGRTLIVVVALFWLLVVVGDVSSTAERIELILGMFIITIIPLMVGFLLELSYQRRKRVRIYIN